MSAWESSVSYAALPVSESPTVLGKVPQAFSSGPGQALPERAELMPGIWRLPLPLRDSPLGHVNTYLVRTDDGYLLVDCGWDTADTLRALEGHLRALDIRLPDVRHLVITHIHPDHYGLAGRLREISSADLSFHRLERLYIESRYVDADELLTEMREWLRLNGTPADELDRLNRGSVSMMERVQIAFPDRTLVLALDEGAERARARDTEGSDRIGGRPEDYHRKVSAAFQLIAAEEPERVKLIDGSGNADDVTRRLVGAIEDLLP